MLTFRAPAAAVLASLLVLAGCSSSTQTDQVPVNAEPTSSEITNEASVELVEEGQTDLAVTPLPAFSSVTLTGESVTQANYEGKPTIMWFWAPWCTVCRAEAPTLAEVATELDGSVDVVGVAALGSIDEMNTFVTDTGISNFSQLADPDAEVWGVFGVASQPAFAFISADGSIDVVQGSLGKDAILQRAADLS
jgi:thiol-disulfide isomerase/thioredoxin